MVSIGFVYFCSVIKNNYELQNDGTMKNILSKRYIVKALRLGAKGYLLKQDYASILPALRAVYSGQTVYAFGYKE